VVVDDVYQSSLLASDLLPPQTLLVMRYRFGCQASNIARADPDSLSPISKLLITGYHGILARLPVLERAAR
jgi:hypothetical protein